MPNIEFKDVFFIFRVNVDVSMQSLNCILVIVIIFKAGGDWTRFQLQYYQFPINQLQYKLFDINSDLNFRKQFVFL